MQMEQIIDACGRESGIPFSGAAYAGDGEGKLFEGGFGYANRSERIVNRIDTRFGMASGCKIFTAAAICQLVEEGRLSFDALLSDLPDMSFPRFDRGITVHHLLTHCSGIPDYFDEETMTDYADLWKAVPAYAMTSPASFLPMFRDKEMKFAPGERFSYSNAGFIVLGLIVERLTGMTFQAYVEERIFRPCGMTDSGYFRMDDLPERTAFGYIDGESGARTNIYAVPVIGGPDGGAFTTVYDMDKFWQALLGNRLLSESMTKTMLTPHARYNENVRYGYGVWLSVIDNEIFKYYVTGSDPGVSMRSSVYPKSSLRIHLLANSENVAGTVARKIDEAVYSGS
ncbi:serine hydrolase domain-containing protein [Paenibacillus arenilitoris]|uniref:Serine hydrolase n=1 Tax=Paenibacillus arenilitoris TaxID=2772299 RepID=A0A927CJV2_9BACL|nr:serine hydrolase [Paenibacillus arenilitoris]MBD2869428.1 serine hydrolase [Paenibacillus arenilitoris]